MTAPYAHIAQSLVDACHRLDAKGFVAATDGNVSARLENGNILITRTLVGKGLVTQDDLVEVDLQGNVKQGQHAPSTELGMHLYIYAERPDVHAVVHAHPPYATGFAAARQSLEGCVLPEVIVGLGRIPLAEYATPSTVEVARSLGPYVQACTAILLSNHGVVTYGADVLEAYHKMEKVEHAAHVSFVARLLGGEQPLGPTDIAKLLDGRTSAYRTDISKRVIPEVSASTIPTDDEIRNLVRQMIQPHS